MSDEDTTDEGKRKGYTGREAGIFQRSKKIGRTPNKNPNKDDGKLDKVLDMLQGLTHKVNQIEDKQDMFIRELKEVRIENEKIKKDNEELKREVLNIKEKVEKLENEKRKRNIVIQGLNIETKDVGVLNVTMKDFLKQELDVVAEELQTRKLGSRTYLIELNKMQDKIEIMRNKNKLRRHKNDRIYINDDLTKDERIIQGKLRQKAKEERAQGKNVKVRYQKLIIDGQIWKWEKTEEDLVRLVIKNTHSGQHLKN